jgi:hypothetical protein
MAFTLTACGGNGDDSSGGSSQGNTGSSGGSGSSSGDAGSTASARTSINMGGWWRPYYFSDDTSVEADPSYSGAEVSHLKFERMQWVQQEYGLPIYFHNLTEQGNLESINTSIAAGTPDMEVYMVDMKKATNIHFSGLTLDLRTILPADHDIFTTQNRMRFIDLMDDKAGLFVPVTDEDVVTNVLGLGFNLQLIEAANLERPDVLWERGEWTWAKFEEYLKILTHDDQYGFGGYMCDFMTGFLMSNGTYIAGAPQENISSKEVGEVLQLISDMYNTWNVCYPYDSQLTNPDAKPGETMRWAYREGKVAFYPLFVWIQTQNEDYNHLGTNDTPLDFDTVWVHWPVGPSGNAETNAGKLAVAGNVYMLPAGLENAEQVFNYMDDYWNWYDSDLNLRSEVTDLSWYYVGTSNKEEIQNHNFQVQWEAGMKTSFDLWEDLAPEGMYDAFNGLVDGVVTPSQVQETLKNVYQAKLDDIFK